MRNTKNSIAGGLYSRHVDGTARERMRWSRATKNNKNDADSAMNVECCD